MKFSSLIVTVLLTAFLASACTATSGSKSGMEQTATKQDYEAALAAANSARKKAASVGGEWRDIGKFLAQAEDAASKGDYTAAVKLAKKVEFQAEAGYAQAMEQKSAGPLF